MLSNYWMGGMYETFRLLRDRGLVEQIEALASIFHELELVRIGLDKHEIPKDQKLTEPMLLAPMQQMLHDKEPYVYETEDPKRAHIMPIAMSQQNGSIMWYVIDHGNERSFWVERRGLSDRIVELWRPQAWVLCGLPRKRGAQHPEISLAARSSSGVNAGVLKSDGRYSII